MVPFWVLIIMLDTSYLGYPKRDHHFDNHPFVFRDWEFTELSCFGRGVLFKGSSVCFSVSGLPMLEDSGSSDVPGSLAVDFVG